MGQYHNPSSGSSTLQAGPDRPYSAAPCSLSTAAVELRYLNPPLPPHPPFTAVTLMSPFSTLRGSALPSFLPVYMGLLFKKHLPTRPSFLLLFLRFCGLYRLICPSSGSPPSLPESLRFLGAALCFHCHLKPMSMFLLLFFLRRVRT